MSTVNFVGVVVRMMANLPTNPSPRPLKNYYSDLQRDFGEGQGLAFNDRNAAQLSVNYNNQLIVVGR